MVLEVDDVSDYSAFLLPNPYRLIIDIHGRKPNAPQTMVARAQQEGEKRTPSPPSRRRQSCRPRLRPERRPLPRTRPRLRPDRRPLPRTRRAPVAEQAKPLPQRRQPRSPSQSRTRHAAPDPAITASAAKPDAVTPAANKPVVEMGPRWPMAASSRPGPATPTLPWPLGGIRYLRRKEHPREQEASLRRAVHRRAQPISALQPIGSLPPTDCAYQHGAQRPAPSAAGPPSPRSQLNPRSPISTARN